MVLKVRAWDSNSEVIIPVSDITGSVVRNREIFDIPNDVSGSTITLAFAPQQYSESVILNGLVMAEGPSYDYTISGNVITFNGLVLTNSGHILVNYSY